MRLSSHSSCCGVKVMRDYGNISHEPFDRVVRIINGIKEQLEIEYYEGGRLIECHFTDQQLTLDNNKLARALKQCGFRKKARWLNTNHGNYVTMFTFSKRPAVACPYPW